ncbi:MAG: CopG family transcriptional regulator [Euryarchaeota archaeon]|nr:CopG family transcriptional regulator [Euryarchaeota archaeon]
MRITTSMDEDTYRTLQALMEGRRRSKSKTIRDAIEFYARYRDQVMDDGRMNLYMELLTSGEHLIIDVDHWILFMRILEGTMEPEEFWEAHHQIARSHGDQFRGKVRDMEGVLKRLEACNLFKLRKASEGEFTLVLGAAPSKRFLKILLEEVAEGLGFDIKIKEDFSKLRVEV